MGRPKGTKFQKSLSLRLGDDAWMVLEKMAEDEKRPIGMMARILLEEALGARKTKEELSGRKKGR